ncbi:GGDEF domain-containing protein [Gilvimarinus agarilyticus]|uniref:GGDEF domain-containing protein n=1 Tax=unclassified Gilvimarinus TaxID=2642066 RepID=UPI001C09B70D|nr:MULTISPECIES: GGDEF domain-containing protein [unclassified Gilvimarinus]MBU2884317.1 GGDEF domain-containing protein [Gilvimarinus agarilyticus]MDO6569456.1 GGDEF domain-containing protein [Gilvimarinus sp. 2_MG-2023]MDO6747613.1 GGDEF domain-containing protein [Gilvimarinus sp. 1_MG-2023]
MSDAGKNKWRDKYLDALDQHEALERQGQEEVKLLQRALLRVSIAATGQQPELDRTLETLRGTLRSGDKGQLQAALTEVDGALHQFDQERDETTRELKGSLQSLIVPLLAREPERPLKRKLRNLAQDVSRQRDLLYIYPSLLHQLAQLQAQVFADQEETGSDEHKEKSSGLMARLLGRSDDSAPSGLTEHKSEPGDTNEIDEEQELNLAQVDRALFELNPNASLRDSATVSDNMRLIITELLVSVEAQNLEPARVQSLQRRLRSGITNADLLPVLEEVRDLIMAAYVAATRAFTVYLSEVNSELADIYQALGVASDASTDLETASATMQADMMAEFEQLSHKAEEATDLNQLKSQVQNRIGNIRAVLSTFQESSKANGPVTEQLVALAQKLKTMESEAEKNRKVLEEQRAKALTDPLTGVPNREAFNERATIEVQRYRRYKNPLSIAIVDLDYFKKINDSFGHQAGDRVLKVLSNAIVKRLRDVDFFGRYGGEEFVVLLPETDAKQAYQCLDKIRSGIARTDFNYRDQPVELTVSIGIAQFSEADTLEAAFERADRALYDAKAAGRNQCKIAELSDEP